MQFALSYFYYLKEKTRDIKLSELFDRIDKDGNGIWSDREIRYLLTKIHDPPITLNELVNFEKIAKECDISVQTLKIKENYYDTDMPQLTFDFVYGCAKIEELLQQTKGNVKLFKTVEMTDRNVM